MSAPEIEPVPWFGWSAEYPDEGAVVVDARDHLEAIVLVREALSADDDDEPMEVVIKPVTAKDVESLQDEIEKLKTKLEGFDL